MSLPASSESVIPNDLLRLAHTFFPIGRRLRSPFDVHL
jgi:hypothetical protein